jgi:hypothetical protein
MWGALSDERTVQSFTIAAGSCQRSHSGVRFPWDWRSFVLFQIETSLFVTSFDSQGYGGGIRPRLRTGYITLLLVSRYIASGRTTAQKTSVA